MDASMSASPDRMFLAFALLSLAFTWNVHRPWFRFVVPSVLSFFLGWLTGELALHHLAAQLVVALLFLGAGAAGTLTGKVALAVLALSFAGLVASHIAAMSTRERVLGELRAVLGASYEEELLPSLAPPAAPPVTNAQRLYPFRIRRPDVEVLRDRVFHQEGRLRLRLDVYRAPAAPPPLPGAPRPMLLYVHGGAWVLGDKERQGLPLLNHLAARGWVCATTSYRLSPRATFPDHLVDVKRAIAWLRAHAAELGGDPGFLVVSGGSAGGHLAALAALTGNDPAYQPGFADADTRLSGCVGIYGVYDVLDRGGHYRNRGLRLLLTRRVLKVSPEADPEAWSRASPLEQVHAGAPPFLLLHGTHDSLVPIGMARDFAAALREAGAEVALAEFPGAQHAFEIFPSVRAGIGLEVTDRFLSHLYSRFTRRRETEPPPPPRGVAVA